MSPTTDTPSAEWKKTACALCSLNCGLLVQTENGHFKKIKGDKAHPASEGYQCQKASQLEFYQNHDQRLTKPLRKKSDGSFEEIEWDVAIQEIADKLVQLREEHGGHSIAYFGGGGQGNHLNGSHGGALRAACGTRYYYTSLAQEKTGGYWLNGRMFGMQSHIPINDHHHSDFIFAIGWNPWQSHGMQQARKQLQEISKDPNRTLVVIDPVCTETAAKADYHIQVRPGGDAHLILAMLAYMFQEGLEDQEFLKKHCSGVSEFKDMLLEIPVDEYLAEAGVDADMVKEVTRKFAAAKGAAVHTDLGLEQSLHSTLNLYLSKLLWVVTGNFANPGGQLFFPHLVPLVGNSKDPEDGGRTTRVTGAREIGKLYPPNSLAREIDNDSPDRLRALIVDSGNPAMTVVDAHTTRAAFEKLELMVTIDVSMTETARLSDYVLPASTQYEKWECTFFNFGFPDNVFHLRPPVFEPQGDTLIEPEIYRRILVAMGALPDSMPELEEAARQHVKDPSKGIFAKAFAKTISQNPGWGLLSSVILYATLGKALPNGAESAGFLWAISQKFAETNPEEVMSAGILDEGAGLGEALFQKIINSPSGMVFSRTKIENSWKYVSNPESRINLVVPEMFEEIEELENQETDTEFPFIVSAGERRSYNSNQNIRTKKWRKKDAAGALRVHPNDAEKIGLDAGGFARVTSSKGHVDAAVEITEGVREGFMTLPHGYGMLEDTGNGLKPNGPDINILSDIEHCDRIAKTPFHKHIAVAVEAIEAPEYSEELVAVVK
jgi:anaerobic selenocysteine-containing dehydrogenase